MNPQSRIKLLQNLEEIRVFENKNYESKWWNISAWGVIIIYFGMIFFQVFSKIINHDSSYVIILYFPIFLSSVWLLLRRQFDEKYKSLANAILELGSIAQETQVQEPAIQKAEAKIIKPKKQAIKRKKK
jgi:hypothetical protein